VDQQVSADAAKAAEGNLNDSQVAKPKPKPRGTTGIPNWERFRIPVLSRAIGRPARLLKANADRFVNRAMSQERDQMPDKKADQPAGWTKEQLEHGHRFRARYAQAQAAFQQREMRRQLVSLANNIDTRPK
jgi:hypothetical protein